MRLLRGNVPLVLDEYDYKFELGKAKLLRDGADVLVISSGFMTMRALEAAKLLAADSVERRRAARADHQAARRGDDPARRPARSGRLVVVAENHSVIGGLGEAVAGAAAAPRRQRRSVPPDRAARRVPRRRRAADAARPLRHFRRSHGRQHQETALRSWSDSALPQYERVLCLPRRRYQRKSRIGREAVGNRQSESRGARCWCPAPVTRSCRRRGGGSCLRGPCRNPTR